MKHIKNFKMFESADSDEFIITDETTLQAFEKELESQLDGRYSYGSQHTFQDIVTYIVGVSIEATGKTSDEANDMTSQLESLFDYNEKSIENEFSDYGRDVEGTNTYRGKKVCEYEAGGDGYAFSATILDITELFEDIKRLIKTGDVNEL
jgi:hypothetical protein